MITLITKDNAKIQVWSYKFKCFSTDYITSNDLSRIEKYSKHELNSCFRLISGIVISNFMVKRTLICKIESRIVKYV